MNVQNRNAMAEWRGAVLGEPVSAREAGEAAIVRGFPALVRTARARLWVAAAVRQLAARRPARPITAAVAVECRAWGGCPAAALAPELIAEALERAGIVADGRQIREAHVYAEAERARPRLELSLRVLA
jgi:hypothetical protein